MLLISFFKKASRNFSVQSRIFLMLFLLSTNRKIFSFLLLSSLSVVGFSQNLDSLLTVAKKTKDDSIKIRMYNKIGFGYIFNDTEQAAEVLTEGKELASNAKFNFGLTELTNSYGILMDVTGKSDSANYFFTKALKMSRKYQFQDLESRCLNNLGMFQWNRGSYQEALDYFFQSLRMNEALDSEKSSAISLSNIGLIYQEMNMSKKALNYHRKALAIREKFNLENAQIISLNNIGINLKNLGRLEEAITTFKNGIAMAKRKNNLLEYYSLLENLANVYYLNGDTDLALETYLLALDKPEDYKAHEKKSISLYNNIATLYNYKSQPKTALRYAEKGFELVKKYPEIKTISADLNLTAAESYYMLDDFERARNFKSQFVAIKDSVFSDKNAEAFANFEVKYESEKKEKEILEQRAEIAENNLIIQRQNYQLYLLIFFTLILVFISYVLYRQQKLKNEQLAKEAELKDALLRIETQNKLQEQRLRISRDLHDNIGAQLTFIISSVDNLKYAFDIKDKTFQDKLDTISAFASETIDELRDTIWAMNKSEISFEDLQARIMNYIDKAHLYDANIKFNFHVEDSVDTTQTFSSIDGMNIYRVIQEAIHNSLKYANANTIIVRVTKEVSNLIFKIIDDGKGFDILTIKRGNGLNNLEKRTTEINGNLTIDSAPTKGTTVELAI